MQERIIASAVVVATFSFFAWLLGIYLAALIWDVPRPAFDDSFTREQTEILRGIMQRHGFTPTN